MARDFIRYGMTEDKTADDVARIFQEQMEWLKNEGEIPQSQTLPPSQKPKAGP